MWLYADERTRESLTRPGIDRVLLFGSYGGYSNFGDILQLKGALRFHAESTRRRPVVVVYLAAVIGAGFVDKLRAWFGVDDVVFVGEAPHDLAALNLGLVTEARAIGDLHVYGGGFLNRYWGRHLVGYIEALHHAFRVERYVVTGQQLDSEFLPELARHFRAHPPRRVGGRDARSASAIAEAGWPGGFSFDDASEVLLGWAARRPVVAPAERLVLQLNTSSYTVDEEAPQALEARLAELAERFPADPLLLQAFDDCRIDVRDTLVSVAGLEEAFPFEHFEVLRLSAMALRLNPTDHAPDPTLGRIVGRLAFASSYHTTIFLNMLGLPCHLHHANAYYRQKSAGLGGEPSFEAFVAEPRVTDYGELLAARRAWQSSLAGCFEATARGPGALICPSRHAGRPVPFRPKGQHAPPSPGRLRSLLARLSP